MTRDVGLTEINPVRPMAHSFGFSGAASSAVVLDFDYEAILSLAL